MADAGQPGAEHQDAREAQAEREQEIGQRADDHRHRCIVPVANAHGLLVLPIDTLEPFDERRHKMAPRLFAVGDDVDAGALLVGQRKAHRVALALGEALSLQQPRRPQLVRRRQPRRLGQTAGDRSR